MVSILSLDSYKSSITQNYSETYYTTNTTQEISFKEQFPTVFQKWLLHLNLNKTVPH